MSSKYLKSGYQKRKAKDKLALMKVANDPKQQKLCFSTKKETAVLTQNLNNFSNNGKLPIICRFKFYNIYSL